VNFLCSGRFDLQTAMWLKIQIFWDVVPCRLANGTRLSEGSCCHHVQGPAGLGVMRRKNPEDVCSFILHDSDAPELQFGNIYEFCQTKHTPWNTQWTVHVGSFVCCLSPKQLGIADLYRKLCSDFFGLFRCSRLYGTDREGGTFLISVGQVRVSSLVR